jgi:predicted molibdopterin-dependent oxidoreductase YjgC
MGCAGNAQGAADFGALPKYLPGYHAVGDAAAGKTLGKIWKSEPPKKAGLSWPEMFAAIEKGQMKALYLVGVDPFDLGLPAEKVESALGKLQLLVVQNLAKSKAMDYAHVVLPSASFLEKEGTATSCERRLQRLAKVISSPGQAKADYDLLSAMLAALKPELKANGIASVFDEAKALFKELEGVNSSAIPVEGIQWPVASENGSGAERLGLPAEDKPKFKFMSKSLKDMVK